jgi:hypothetical protein
MSPNGLPPTILPNKNLITHTPNAAPENLPLYQVFERQIGVVPVDS